MVLFTQTVKRMWTQLGSVCGSRIVLLSIMPPRRITHGLSLPLLQGQQIPVQYVWGRCNTPSKPTVAIFFVVRTCHRHFHNCYIVTNIIIMIIVVLFSISRPEHNGSYFADHIFKCIFLEENHLY